MRPSKIQTGEKLLVKTGLGIRIAFFVRRVPARSGQRAVNYLRFPDYVGMDGPEDDGICQMSDYDVSRRVCRVV